MYKIIGLMVNPFHSWCLSVNFNVFLFFCEQLLQKNFQNNLIAEMGRENWLFLLVFSSNHHYLFIPLFCSVLRIKKTKYKNNFLCVQLHLFSFLQLDYCLSPPSFTISFYGFCFFCRFLQSWRNLLAPFLLQSVDRRIYPV